MAYRGRRIKPPCTSSFGIIGNIRFTIRQPSPSLQSLPAFWGSLRNFLYKVWRTEKLPALLRRIQLLISFPGKLFQLTDRWNSILYMQSKAACWAAAVISHSVGRNSPCCWGNSSATSVMRIVYTTGCSRKTNAIFPTELPNEGAGVIRAAYSNEIARWTQWKKWTTRSLCLSPCFDRNR
jgi:hypothetical protein